MLIARISSENLKDSDKALSALEAGLQLSQTGGTYLSLSLIRYKAYVLAGAGQYDQAQALFKKELPRCLSEPKSDFMYLNGFLTYYLASARDAGKMDGYISDVRPLVAAHPELVTLSPIGPEIVRALLDRPGKEAEALSWAKLYWMTCDFDEKTLVKATALLQKAWIAKDTNTVQGSAFLTAMQDAKADNPLHAIPLPELDAAKLRAAIEALPSTSVHSRITLLLMLGENGQAMLTARRILLDDPTGQAAQAALEIARVFKATDLNLVRANAFLQYFQHSTGENPLDEFFKQNPVGGK